MSRIIRYRRSLVLRIVNFKGIPKLRRVQGFIIRVLTLHYDSIPPDVTPFVILATARSGSTLLEKTLAANWASIRSNGEIFNPQVRKTAIFEQVLDRSYCKDVGHGFVGSKILDGHVSDLELDRILALPRMRVVVLERNNVVRQYVSLLIARKDNLWRLPSHSERSHVSSRAVHVDSDELIGYRAKQAAAYERFARHTSGKPAVEVTYEEMMGDLDATIEKIGLFLGAGHPDRSVPSKLLRQNPEPLRDLILNFDDLRRSLSAGGHSDLVSYLES